MASHQIRITVDTGLPEQAGRISHKTWLKVKQKKGGSGFFPEGGQMLVGDPFTDNYILLVVDNGLEDDLLVVSRDVKEKFYGSRTTIDL